MSGAPADDGEGVDALSPIAGDVDEVLFCAQATAASLQSDMALVRSEKLLRSWVTQSSPCCAAASVAGALNALALGSSDPWTCAQVMEFYKAMTRKRVASQKHRVQLLSGGECGRELESLRDAVSSALAATDVYELGGTTKIPRELLLETATAVVRESPAAFPVLHSALLARESAEHDAPDAGDESASGRASSMSVAFEIEWKTKRLNFVKQTDDLLSAVYEYLHLVDGLAKLERVEKPSTAICGNEAILRAVEAINASESDRKRVGGAGTLTASLFMGAALASVPVSTPRRSVTVQISSGDSATQRAAAWRAMWAELSRDHSVLIYHLKNHYALVFAMRERQEVDGSDDDAGEEQDGGDATSSRRRQRREILTARRGQRPSAWVAWEEVYATLCSWSGYKIIRVGID